MNQSSINQEQTHYATVFEVGLDGSPEQGKFFGTCQVLGCPWATPFYTSAEDAWERIPEHNGRVFNDLPPGGTDWYKGRALMPWEENYSPQAQHGIVYGPGAV